VKGDMREYSWGLARIPHLKGFELLINYQEKFDDLSSSVLDRLKSIGVAPAK